MYICVTTIWRDETSYDDDTTMYNNVIRTNGSPRDLRGSLTIKQRDPRSENRTFRRVLPQKMDAPFLSDSTSGRPSESIYNNINAWDSSRKQYNSRCTRAYIMYVYLPRACNCHLIATSIRVVDRMYYVYTYLYLRVIKFTGLHFWAR